MYGSVLLEFSIVWFLFMLLIVFFCQSFIYIQRDRVGFSINCRVNLLRRQYGVYGVINNLDLWMFKFWFFWVLYFCVLVFVGLFCDLRGIDVKRCFFYQFNSFVVELGQLSYVDKKQRVDDL